MIKNFSPPKITHYTVHSTPIYTVQYAKACRHESAIALCHTPGLSPPPPPPQKLEVEDTSHYNTTNKASLWEKLHDLQRSEKTMKIKLLEK